jgi:hypothetical protein
MESGATDTVPLPTTLSSNGIWEPHLTNGRLIVARPGWPLLTTHWSLSMQCSRGVTQIIQGTQ